MASIGSTKLRTEVVVQGMHCGACAARVQSALAGTAGVRDARVNFASSRATVLHDSQLDLGALREVIERAGYSVSDESQKQEHDKLRIKNLQRLLIVACALTAVVFVPSMFAPLRFEGWRWVSFVASGLVVFGAGFQFHRNALRNLAHRNVTMDTLISLGTTAAWTWSAVVLIADIQDGHVYFETGCVIITLVLAGKWMEARATRRSGQAVRALARLGTPTALLVDGTEVDVDQLQVGTRFVVRPGERIATDGVVVHGASAVDMSMVTGESVPVEVAPGDEVIGATINADGTLEVAATRVGADTALAQIVRLVDEAQGGRAKVQRLADLVARVFVPVVVGIAMVTFVVWFAIGGAASDALTAAVAVLIISCPCALGLATPLAVMVGTGRAAQLGVIIKGAEVLEDTRRTAVVLLDKTGTVTDGRLEVAGAVAVDGADMKALGLLAGALESRSEHPVGAAIARRWLSLRRVTEFKNRPGLGVQGRVHGAEVRVGRYPLFDEVPEQLQVALAEAEARGHTAVLVGRGATAEAVISLADTVKETSPEAVQHMRDLGLDVALLTGDNRRTAQTVGAAIGVSDVHAELMPDDKVELVRAQQANGTRVAFVGDGVNDAPALAHADLGIALGTGADVAVEASDLTIIGSDLRAVPEAISLSRRTLRTIEVNLFWAFAYNTAAIPLAAAGVLSPMAAAAAMGLSSLFVVTNSLRLRRFGSVRS